jgi:uncharacterized protein YecT (DUF1311 family)
VAAGRAFESRPVSEPINVNPMPRLRVPLLAAVLGLVASVSPAASQKVSTICPHAFSTLDMRECLTRLNRRADAELNRAYASLLRKYADTAAQLRTAELAWIRYRNAECRFEAADAEGGTEYPLQLLLCQFDMTNARTRELRNMLNGGAHTGMLPDAVPKHRTDRRVS